jgi:hypothetical protein
MILIDGLTVAQADMDLVPCVGAEMPAGAR